VPHATPEHTLTTKSCIAGYAPIAIGIAIAA
jgi:hypothetical protein